MIEMARQLFRYRSLVWALVVRHLSLRYRGSMLGFLWSFLNPLCLMVVYTLVFRYYVRFDQVHNYTIFLFCGLLPWIWITSGISEGVTSVVGSGHLITKSMFPAYILPFVSVVTSMIHFLLSLPLLFIFMALTGMPIHGTLALLPIIVLLQFILLLGLSLGLGALNVHYRDVQHIVGNVLTLLFFLCPILYPRESVPEPFRFTLDLNPLALLTTFYHQVILEGVIPPLWPVVYASAAIGLCLILGSMIFSRYNESFAELL